jgi:hypothetical protein
MPPALAHRVPALLAAVVAGGLAGGCGEDEARRAPAPVALEVLEPGDAAVVDGDAVTLRGRVRPAASEVAVRGRRAEVRAGTWTAEVELEEGANVIDVSATAAGRRPALAAVRVVRRVPIEVPELDGEDPQAAVDALEALGLEPRVERGGGLLDDLLPATLGVCSTDPEAGTEVRVGTTITLEVAKVC